MEHRYKTELARGERIDKGFGELLLSEGEAVRSVLSLVLKKIDLKKFKPPSFLLPEVLTGGGSFSIDLIRWNIRRNGDG